MCLYAHMLRMLHTIHVDAFVFIRARVCAMSLRENNAPRCGTGATWLAGVFAIRNDRVERVRRCDTLLQRAEEANARPRVPCTRLPMYLSYTCYIHNKWLAGWLVDMYQL